MRCKACDASLYKSHDDTYCRKCIIASEETDVYNDTVYQNNLENNHELRVQLFLRQYEREELLRNNDWLLTNCYNYIVDKYRIRGILSYIGKQI